MNGDRHYCPHCKQYMSRLSHAEREQRSKEAVRRYLAGESPTALAKEYGVARTTINSWAMRARDRTNNARTGH